MGLPIRAIRTQFDPRRIPNLVVWLDGSDSSTLYDATTGGSLPADGTAVARWEDKSGRGHHATQDQSGNDQPLRRAGAANGRDTLEFDGVNDFMTIGGTPLSAATSASVLAVVDKLSASNNGGAIWGISGWAFSNNHHPWTDGKYYDGFGSNTRYSYTSANRTDRHVLAVTAGAQYRAYVDGVQIYENASNTFVAPTRYLIGGDNTNSFLGVYAQIPEVMLFSRDLTASEVGVLYQYLRAKWNTT